jgi:hypothetical protein
LASAGGADGAWAEAGAWRGLLVQLLHFVASFAKLLGGKWL